MLNPAAYNESRHSLAAQHFELWAQCRRSPRQRTKPGLKPEVKVGFAGLCCRSSPLMNSLFLEDRKTVCEFFNFRLVKLTFDNTT